MKTIVNKLSPAKKEIISQARRFTKESDAFNKLSDEQKANHLENKRMHRDPSKTDTYDKLDNLAAEIKLRVKICKKEIFKIGELLTEAKRLSGHGSFQQWVENNCDFSYETANNFMNAYKYCLGYFELLETVPLSIIYMVASPNFPSDFREYLFATGEIKIVNIRSEIRDLLDKYKNGEIDFTSPALNKLFKANRDYNAFNHYIQLLDSLQQELSKYFNIFDNLDHPIKYIPKERTQEKCALSGEIMECELYPEVPPDIDPCVAIRNFDANIQEIKDDLKSLRDQRVNEFFEEIKM
jgi:hypothetical protein